MDCIACLDIKDRADVISNLNMSDQATCFIELKLRGHCEDMMKFMDRLEVLSVKAALRTHAGEVPFLVHNIYIYTRGGIGIGARGVNICIKKMFIVMWTYIHQHTHIHEQYTFLHTHIYCLNNLLTFFFLRPHHHHI